MRSHFAVVMVTLTGVGGGLLLLAASDPPGLTGDEHGEWQGDEGDAPEETAGPCTGDDIESCFLCIEQHHYQPHQKASQVQLKKMLMYIYPQNQHVCKIQEHNTYLDCKHVDESIKNVNVVQQKWCKLMWMELM